MDALEVKHRETVAICQRMFGPLQEFVNQGDLVQQLADREKEVASTKVANSHLRKENKRLMDKLTYWKEKATVKAASTEEGVTAALSRHMFDPFMVQQMRGLLDSL